MMARWAPPGRIVRGYAACFALACLGACDESAPIAADAMDDTQAPRPSAFAVQLPLEIAEGVRFPIGVQALNERNLLAAEYHRELAVSASWGELTLEAPLAVEAGLGQTLAALNREGDVTLRIGDDELEQTAGVRVIATPWGLSPQDPVLRSVVTVVQPSDPPHWTFAGVRRPSVSSDGDTLWAWFTCPPTTTKPDGDDAGSVLGRARSDDAGARFTLDPDEPLLAASDLGLATIADAHVRRGPDRWHLWLSGRDAPEGAWRLVHLESDDGTEWSAAPCLDLEADPTRNWMNAGVRQASAVWLDGGQLRLYFTAQSEAALGGQIGVVTGSCAGGFGAPVLALPRGANQSWEERSVEQPHVWREGSVYKLLYVGTPSTGAGASIGYATSADGVAWVRSPSNPVWLRDASSGSPSNTGVGAPSAVLLPAGRLAMFFEGRSFQGRASLGRALGPLR